MSRLPLLVLLSVSGAYGAGCASTGAVPKPFPTPAPRTSRPTPAPDVTQPAERGNPPDDSVDALGNFIPVPPGTDGYLIAGRALQYRGTPYRLGGADPQGG